MVLIFFFFSFSDIFGCTVILWEKKTAKKLFWGSKKEKNTLPKLKKIYVSESIFFKWCLWSKSGRVSGAYFTKKNKHHLQTKIRRVDGACKKAATLECFD